MTRILLEGFALGLSAGIYCAGSCLAFFMPYLMAEGERKIPSNVRKITSFLAGRFIAYIAFALIIGLIGNAYRDVFTSGASHICLIGASLLMLGYSVANLIKGRHDGACSSYVSRSRLARVPFFLGLFTGLNPCPPFLLGASRILTMADVSGGAVFFAAFFAGTSVYMAPLIFVPYLARGERIKQIGMMVAFLSGVWFLVVGIAGLLR
ncbi:MAG: sulfite exporter TauE/SafE family protein [Candidatus Omnitrophica bacterium]|nr:sulfite exporter TauE/SafE family protein [Candidatus Omnitrophota bacterium]